MRTRREFRHIWKQAQSGLRFRSLSDVSKMLRSRKGDSRLQGLFTIRQQLAHKPLAAYFSLAKTLVTDSDNDCRWQSLIVIGEYIQTRPAGVWRVILRHANSADEDMRSAVARVLLEHLLEYHFTKFFPSLRREAIRSPLFADTLSRCSPFGQAERHWHKVKLLQVRLGGAA